MSRSGYVELSPTKLYRTRCAPPIPLLTVTHLPRSREGREGGGCVGGEGKEGGCSQSGAQNLVIDRFLQKIMKS